MAANPRRADCRNTSASGPSAWVPFVTSDRLGGRVWQTNRTGWWLLFSAALVIVAAWPPDKDRSLAVKAVNWAVDPLNRLPVLPPQLGYGRGDDPVAVEARDAQVRHYDALYNVGGWTRRRLALKVAEDPFNPTTERQLLLGFGVIVAFLVWRAGGRAA